MNLTTLPKLKTHLGIVENSRDAELTAIIESASAVLEAELWQSIQKGEYTRRLDSFGTGRIVMEAKISLPTTVEYTRDKWESWADVEIDYIEGQIIYLRRNIPKGRKNLRVTYTKWYDNVPADLESFFLVYVQKMMQANIPNSDEKEIKTKKLDGLSITYFWPNELTSSDAVFKTDYNKIKNKYRVLNFHANV